MQIEDFHFDLETQRFIKNRLETNEGKIVLKDIISAIKNSNEIRGILDKHVVKHHENSDSYGFPIYPKDRINDESFWVLNHDDLRGIVINNQDFSKSTALAKKIYPILNLEIVIF